MQPERKSNKAYFMFGRFNPVTIGHGAIFKQLAEDATQDGADAYVFVSSTQNSEKNPLSVDRKLYYINKLYGNLGIHFINTTTCTLGKNPTPCKGPPLVIARLREMGYTHLYMYVGSDRLEDFQWIPKANMKKIEQGANINPVVLVNKMPPRTGNNFVASMSASKIREAALKDPVNESSIQFIKNGTGLSENDAKGLLYEIRTAIPRHNTRPFYENTSTPKKRRKKGGKRHTCRRHTYKMNKNKK